MTEWTDEPPSLSSVSELLLLLLINPPLVQLARQLGLIRDSWLLFFLVDFVSLVSVCRALRASSGLRALALPLGGGAKLPFFSLWFEVRVLVRLGGAGGGFLRGCCGR